MGSPLRLALKWLPIEVLRNRRHVHPNIDQWSFGVVMWELMTRAYPPYDDVSNQDLEWLLNSGKRLPQPVQCPNVLFEIMLSCWKSNPVFRVGFSSSGLIHFSSFLSASFFQSCQTIKVHIRVRNRTLSQAWPFRNLLL